MRALSLFRAILILTIALAAGCGGEGDVVPDAEADAGTDAETDAETDAGTDGDDGDDEEDEVEPPPAPEIHGKWTRTCDHLVEQDAIDACLDAPDTLALGRSVLGDPATFRAVGELCGTSNALGTFTYAAGRLELFNCGDGDPQGAPDAVGLAFEARFEDEGERLILTREDAEYVFDRSPRAETTVISGRVISIERGCESFDPALNAHSITEDESPGWIASLVIQNGEIFMDECFSEFERTKPISWSFYNKDNRGAQMRSFPLEAGIPATVYRIFRDEDLTPIHATGFEMDDCDPANESAVRAFEHDFMRGVTFRRFWSEEDAGATSTVEVDLEGTIEEALVTLQTGTLPNASELTISLTSPHGTTVELLAAGTLASEESAEFAYTSFADSAAKSLTDPEISSLVDLFAPESPLAALEGEPMAGTWTLSLSRASDEGAGSITYFGLSLR